MCVVRYVLVLALLIALPGSAGAITSAPLTDFTADRTAGGAPWTVQFNDTSAMDPATGWAWYFGDETYMAPWTLVNASAEWTTCDSHSTVATRYGGIVLTGGKNQYMSLWNKTYLSMDHGNIWTLVNASSGWTARQMHPGVVLSDTSIVLMGGLDNVAGHVNDTWRSTDNGAHWTLMNASSGWEARRGHTGVALSDGSIVLMGGSDGSVFFNDTWRSTDNGATWVRVNASSGWSKRYGHCSVAMPDGTIVLMGGSGGATQNDTWLSTDKGGTWRRTTAAAPWTGRYRPACVAVPDGSIVLTGGSENYLSYRNDTWRSVNYGVNWVQVNLSPPGWQARNDHSTVVMPDGSIMLTGGSHSGVDNFTRDVWQLRTAGSLLKNASHTYTVPGVYSVTLQASNAGGYNRTRKTGFVTVTTSPISRLGAFRNTTHLFYEDWNGNGAWNGALMDRSYNFGITGDIPISGDWTGDGKTEIGVFRPSTHLFYLDWNGNGVWNGALTDKSYSFGITGDVPITGDWNNDGKTEIGVYRPSARLFYLDWNGNGVWNGALTDKSYSFGITGDVPITGDWNNDGKTEIGVYRPSTHLFYLDWNGNGAWNGALTDKSYSFGMSGDIPVTGDWTGDGKTEIGVYRPSTHLFYLDWNGNGAWNGALTDRSYSFGITGDTPLTGAW